jgi:hypothetical protein
MTLKEDHVQESPKPAADKKLAKPKVEAKTSDTSELMASAVAEELQQLEANPVKLAKVIKIVGEEKPLPGDVVRRLYSGLKSQLKRELLKSERDKVRELLKTALLRK